MTAEMVMLRITWVLVFVALSVVIIPVIIYDELHPSSLCQYGVTNPFTGQCIGSVIFGSVSLEHEYFGVGIIAAAALLRNSPLRNGLIIFGSILFISDFANFTALLSGTAGDFGTNPAGSVVSGGLGFGYGFSISEIVHEEDLGEIDI